MIVVALGSNLPSYFGPPEATIRRALDTISAQLGPPRAVSHLWRTQAWPDRHDPPFVNAAASLATPLEPRELLEMLHRVEAEFGRDRREGLQRNAPRPLDLDLIDYNGLVQAGPPELPHLRMHERAFVLVPLREIAPGWRHPVNGRTVDELIAALPRDALAMERL